MTSNEERQDRSGNNSWLNIELYIRSDRAELLQGLERLLELNLIGEEQVKHICRQHLSCALPEKTVTVIKDVRQVSPVITSQALVKVNTKPNPIAQLWQSFLDELSIRWLLFLGIFLVVVSSGVLAASQWDNFPRFGQYLILLFYTLGFWGIGYGAGKQNNLKLTSQTLKAIAILLVPINFWAIGLSGFSNNLLEWLTIAIASIALTAITYFQFQLQNQKQYFLLLFLLLSYVHLGWQTAIIPFIAIYGGIIGISWLHFQLVKRRKYPITKLLFLFAAWSLLLLRLVSSEVLIADYSLAIALFGWLLATIYLTIEKKQILTESQEAEQTTIAFLSKVFQIIGIIILFVTWSFSLIVGITRGEFFLQLAISGLAIHLFGQRLTLYWRKRDLTAIFFIGLQTFYLAKELIPLGLRNYALNFGIQISQTEYFPESIFGVTLFPYVVLFVSIATWLYRRQKRELAWYAESLTLLLGIFLTCLSFINPLWRSLNLLLSTATLAYVVSIRQPLRITLVYLAHLLGLLTLTNAIFVVFPGLSQVAWGSVFTLLAVAEWKIYLDPLEQPRIRLNARYLVHLQQSCWYFGLLLAAVGYSFYLFDASRWGLVWSIVPGMLTIIARHTRKIQQRRLAIVLSCITLIAAQLLVVEQPVVGFVSLAIAVGLMLVNALTLRRTSITVIHIGFGLSAIARLLYDCVADWNWLVVGAIAIWGLYWLRQYLQKFLATPKFAYTSQRVGYGRLGVGSEPINKKLIGKYTKAADYWAICLITSEISVLSFIYLISVQAHVRYLFATILVTAAVIWRYRRQPNNLVLYAVVWLVELFLAGAIALFGGNNLTLAVANIILGLLSFVFISRLATSTWGRTNLSYIPLVYAVLGILLRVPDFNYYTGFITLGAAIILINTNLNEPRTNLAIKYLAFGGISLGIYEIVIYQMQLTSKGSAADTLTILALVAAAIAFSYRFATWWYRQRERRTIFTVNLSQVIFIAHIHWAFSSLLKIIAAGIAIESATPRLVPISLATSFCLGAYALIQGREDAAEATNSIKVNDWWVYVGLVEIVATLVYSRLIITKLSLFDPWRVIFTCAVALAIYQIPWQNLGWRATPWQRTASVVPALTALVTAEDISYFSLLAIAIFYLRIAYRQNIRWSYLSLGFLNWGMMRLIWQFHLDYIWLAAIICLSILYIAQYDPAIKSRRQQRHYVRLVGSSILCVAALVYRDIGIVPGAIALCSIFLGLGFKVRAFLFVGTITLILTVVDRLIILVLAYSFLKWIVGLLAGICLIVIAAGFEKQRDRMTNRLQTYTNKFHNWQ